MPTQRGGADVIAFNIPGAGVRTINVLSALPAITGPVTIDGTTQTANQGDDNPGLLGSGGTVGVGADGRSGTGDELALNQVAAPDVEIRGTNAIPFGIVTQANDITIRGLAIYGFGTANIEVLQNTNSLRIESNVIGSSATSFTDPGPGVRSGGANIRLAAGGLNNGTIQNNLIGFAAGRGVVFSGQAGTFQITGNEVRSNGLTDSTADGIDLSGDTTQFTLRGNLVVDNRGFGVDLRRPGGGGGSNDTIDQNTLSGNGVGGIETAGIVTGGPDNRITSNIISANYGAGVLVNSISQRNTISKNSIFANGTILAANGAAATGQIGIDLLTPTDNQFAGTAPYVTINKPGGTGTGGNELFNYPILSNARIVGGFLELSGFTVNASGVVIDLYITDGDPRGFGEGRMYLVTLTEDSTADLDDTSGNYGPAPINGLSQGQDVNAHRFRFQIPLASLPGVGIGTQLTATGTLSNRTSEFSGRVTVVTVGGTVQGVKFQDMNGNGVRDPGDPGMSGVTIYLDLNANDQLDPGEPNTLTLGDGTYTLAVASDGTYLVREVVPFNFYQTTPDPAPVTIAGGANVPGINFGNQAIVPPVTGGRILGTKFEDLNGNALRDAGEPGLGGFTIFIDSNANGLLDPGELFTTSAADGAYALVIGADGSYLVCEVAQPGFRQTTPNPPAVVVTGGADVPGIDFGNQQIPLPTGGLIRGVKFEDLNGNGVQDVGDPGLPGVTVFIDSNANNQLDPGEVNTVTAPDGTYTLTVGADGVYLVREVVPAGFLQTTPNPVPVNVAGGTTVSGIDFGNQTTSPLPTGGRIFGVKFEDLNSNGVRDAGEPGLGGFTIFIDSNANGLLDPGEVNTVTAPDGTYTFVIAPDGTYLVREVSRFGFVQTSLNPPPVVVAGGTFVSGIDFGNRRLAPILPAADLQIGKVFDRTVVTQGEQVTFTLTVRNLGPRTATDVIVSDPLLGALEFVSASASQGSYDPSTGLWAVGTLLGGATATLQVVVRVTAVGQVANVAIVSAQEFDPSLADNIATAILASSVPEQEIGKWMFIASSFPSTQGTSATAFLQMTPPPTGSEGRAIVAVGAGAGNSPLVAVFDRLTGQLRMLFLAYDEGFLGGVNVALGDVTRDGVLDIITAAGAGGGPHVKVFDGRTGREVQSFYAYDEGFRGGVNVAVADVNGDNRADIVTGAGAGGGPHVKVFDGRTGAVLQSFYAYDPAFAGGVNVAVGELNADGVPDIVTGARAGGGPHVKVFDGQTVVEIRSFFAYDPIFAGGVNVAVGHLNVDGVLDVITAAGAGGGPNVKVFDGHTGQELRSYFAYEPAFTGGVNVAAGDFNEDRQVEVLAAGASGFLPRVRVLGGLTGNVVEDLFGTGAGLLGGVSVAVGRRG